MDLEARLQRFKSVRSNGSLNQERPGFIAPSCVSSPMSKGLGLSDESIDFKVGLYRSRGRLGRAAQAVGSTLLPGDTSKLRNPVRSTVAGALTPGGGRVGAPIGGIDKFRCPAGFENGGRFTGRNLEGCGRHLFVPASGFDLPRLGRGSRSGNLTAPGVSLGFDVNIPNAGETSARSIRGSKFSGRAVQVARNADIPRTGGTNPSKRDANIAKAASLVKSNDRHILIRRDGVALEPLDISSLGGLRSNPDMEGATLVSSGRNDRLGASQVPLLFTTQISAVTFALPDGKTASLIKNRPISSRERVALQAAWASRGGAEGLASLAKASNGALRFGYSGDASEWEDIRIRPVGGGASRMVPRWVFKTYLQRGAPAKTGSQTWVQVTDG